MITDIKVSMIAGFSNPQVFAMAASCVFIGKMTSATINRLRHYSSYKKPVVSNHHKGNESKDYKDGRFNKFERFDRTDSSYPPPNNDNVVPPPHFHFKKDIKDKKDDLIYFDGYNYTAKPNKGTTYISSPFMNRKKDQIPKTLRMDVWNAYFGDEKGAAPCPVCGKRITQMTFQCCHIVAKSKGGPTTMRNLIPGCDHCNQSMGTMNLFEFKELYYP